MFGHRVGVRLAVVAAVVAAGTATLVLRPRSGLVEPEPVGASAYFTAAELDRARDFRRPQRAIGLLELGLTGGLLAFVALRPPRRLRRALERAGARPLRGAAVAGAGLSLALVVVALPLDAVQHERSVDVGLATQEWGAWLGDKAKAAGIEALFAAGGAALGLALVRRFPRNWWVPGAGAVVALAVAFTYVAPVVLDPIFNRFEPLPPGELRSDVLDLADRAGVDVGEVYRIDASRRTTGANAYVGGLGPTKRVVLYDNLLEGFPPEQVRAVVAHELAHVKHRDVPRGIAWLAIVAPFGLLVAQRLTERLAPEPSGGRRPGPEALPALALSLALVSFALAAAGNVLSRQVEARADAFALRLTGDPAAFVDFERRITRRNVSDPDPPALLHALFGTHPTTVERIGIGLAFARARDGARDQDGRGAAPR